MFGELLAQVRKSEPLIHCITNYVTVNDCANVLLAAGASPIMADDADEAAEITALCGGLCVNIGTLNSRTVAAMLAAGKQANACGRPAVLDPVGAGASKLRTQTAARLLEEVRFTVVRGNASEIKTLAAGTGAARGVDASQADAVTAETLADTVALARDFAGQTGAVVVITGATDIVTDGRSVCCVRNGHPMMGRVTGTGCQLSALVAAFVAANPGCVFEAASAAVCAMGLCGEIAHARLAPGDGNMRYRDNIIDAVFNLTAEALERGGNYEIRA